MSSTENELRRLHKGLVHPVMVDSTIVLGQGTCQNQTKILSTSQSTSYQSDTAIGDTCC